MVTLPPIHSLALAEEFQFDESWFNRFIARLIIFIEIFFPFDQNLDNLRRQYCKTFFPIKVVFDGPFPASFSFIFAFSIQQTMYNKNSADDWIRTADLWRQK